MRDRDARLQDELWLPVVSRKRERLDASFWRVRLNLEQLDERLDEPLRAELRERRAIRLRAPPELLPAIEQNEL